MYFNSKIQKNLSIIICFADNVIFLMEEMRKAYLPTSEIVSYLEGIAFFALITKAPLAGGECASHPERRVQAVSAVTAMTSWC